MTDMLTLLNRSAVESDQPFAGHHGLVLGVTSDRSLALEISRTLMARGATCAFGIPRGRLGARAREAVDALGAPATWCHPCDLTRDGDVDVLLEDYAREHDRLDFVVHAVGADDAAWQRPEEAETPRRNFLGALEVAVYSLIDVARRARPLLARGLGGTILAARERARAGAVDAAAGAALEATVARLAREMEPERIRVQLVPVG